jgi:hypothetical protein
MRWRRNRGVIWRTAPGYLALATVDGRTLEIDGPGSDVWARLVEWIHEEELTTALAEQYRADEQIVYADVRSLLEQLHAQGYVDRED